MADLSAIEQKLQAQYKSSIDASNANLQAQLDAATGKNTLDMAQANTAKAAIPTTYDPQRAGAALTMAQANSALPENVLNRGSSIGANGNSGLAYSMGANIGNSYQKNMGLIGAAQNKSLDTAQQNIDNMGLAFTNNQNQIMAQKTGAANTIQAQGDVAIQNEIDAEAAAQAKAQLDQQNFEQTQANNRSNAIIKANSAAAGKALTPEEIASNAMNADGSYSLVPQLDKNGKPVYNTVNGSAVTTNTIDYIGAYNNITAGLQANGIDPNSAEGQRAYVHAGVTQQKVLKSIDNQVHTLVHVPYVRGKTDNTTIGKSVVNYIQSQIDSGIISETQADSIMSKYGY
jgi:hypothetical protein